MQLTAAEFFRILRLLERREQLSVAFAGWLGPHVSEIYGLKWQYLCGRSYQRRCATGLSTGGVNDPDRCASFLCGQMFAESFNNNADFIWNVGHQSDRA